MRIDEDRSTAALAHIEKMAKLFSDRELQTMRNELTERERWTAFYRIWCLKESVLKATGIGLVNDLQNYDFHTGAEKHRPGCYITSTKWYRNGIRQQNWSFEESFINEDHCVAVARVQPISSLMVENRKDEAKNLFSLISFENLLNGSTVLSELEDGGIKEYEEYATKPTKPF
ncbi:4'-phosphopantetheinyl transferase family protein [Dictyocaulus viviparus]|uniref:L-aminoadipate-semialdehyde dehydrogenase-phosphopantetheinyl transferase n=1 Tax=Dictyocaulus viviparus TaxID=29172 RepID=A0A0D8XZK5_DICVI|nr:4'-phosphopantetheinyl transferase family protein [Dictyocaulus viviparus]